jgi:hypothetical protein
MTRQGLKQEISDATGFDFGEPFTSEAEVRDYFTMASMRDMSPDGDFGDLDDETLSEWADVVIAERWHCDF